MGVRQEHKDRTRRELGRAAVRLFTERGFDGATIEDVAEAAGVSRRTFFRYFPTKEAAFFAGHDARLDAFRERVEARVDADGAWVAVREGLLSIAASYEEDRAASLAWRRVMRSHDVLVAYDLRFDVAWERHVSDTFVRGGTPAWEARIRAGAVMGVVRAVLDDWYEAEGTADLEAMGRRAFRCLEAGFAP